MKKRKNKLSRLLIYAVFLLSCISLHLNAQERVLTGTVVDSETNEPLIGATVVVTGTSIGTTCDLDGNFQISVSDGQSITVGFIGYISEEIAISGQTNIDVTLSPDRTELDEIVVVGYGTQKKIELTGAVSSVKSEDLVSVVSSDFTKSLQGQVAGVNVTQQGGRPGEASNVQIRGLGSITGSSSPLYVVDGIPYDDNPNIASEDIASVDILKDGAAAAVYGTRASNGVIIITTKRGEEGKTRVSFKAEYGVQNITSGTPLLNTPEHLYVNEMMLQSANSSSPLLYYNPNAINYNTDFVGAITNNNAPIQNYNLTINGGKENLKFNVNTNYFKQDGVLINSGYERFSTRANTSFEKGKFSAFVSVGVQTTEKENEPYSLYEYAIFQGPYRPPLTDLDENTNEIYVEGRNPDHVGFFAQLLGNSDIRKTNSFNTSANLKYEIIEGLTYQLNLGNNYYNYIQEAWEPQFLVYDNTGELNVSGSREVASLEETFRNTNKVTMENVLNYQKSFGSHNLTLTAVYSLEKTNWKETISEKSDFISNSKRVFDAGSQLVNISGTKKVRGITGKLFRAQYNYADKYMLSGSIRYDGSSKFGTGKTYSTFPGVSAGWVVSNENFMSNLNIISNLKLRASYAQVGNEGIDEYLYEAVIDNNIDYVFGPESSGTLARGSIQRGYANEFVAWESAISSNIGLDLSMWEGKFQFTAEYYESSKEDMLLAVRLPPSTGTTINNDWADQYNTKISNVGDMVNKGIELTATYKHRAASGLGSSVTGMFSRIKNEVTDMGDIESYPLQDSKPGQWRADFQDVTTYMRQGYEAGAFFLIPTDGVIKTEEELAEVQVYMPNAQLGDVKYIDVNNDSTINDDDRVYKGSGMPKFDASLKFDFDYKGFDLGILLYYSHGNKIYNGSKNFAYGMGRHKDLYYMWTPANSTSDIPSARNNSEHDNFRSRSDFFLEEGSYLRLRSLTLGYTVPKDIFKGHIEKMRIYLTAQNLITITKYEGYDPEVDGDNMGERGVDKGNYPVSRNIMMGITVDF